MRANCDQTHSDQLSIPGQYLFMESSWPRRPGDTARIQSELFTPTPSKGRCMSFWYHMYGPDIGNLTVYMNVTGTKVLQPLWRLSGNQGNQWFNGKLPIRSTQSYMVSTCMSQASTLFCLLSDAI